MKTCRIATISVMGALALMVCREVTANTIDQTPPPAMTGPASFYVATNGNDGWSGRLADPNGDKTDGPYATLERARSAVRDLKRFGANSGKAVIVEIRGGYYSLNSPFELQAEDSGTPGSPVIYRGRSGETVHLSGGHWMPPGAFAPVVDPKILQRLDPTVRGRLQQAGLEELGNMKITMAPTRYRGVPLVPELFFNEKRMTVARWPNKGWATIAKIIDSGSRPRDGDKSNRCPIFEYSGKRPANWNVGAGVWLKGYWCYDWYAETIRVKTVDPQERQISLAAPAHYSLKQGNPSPRRYYALNLLEELDQPGEYYIDGTAKRLYFLPPGELAGARIELSTLNGPIFSLTNVSHVVIHGFVIENSLRDGIQIIGGRDNTVEACEICNTRQLGIKVSGGVHHRIQSCDIHDTGTGGIALAGGDRKSLTAGRHEAVNNHIWRFSQNQLTYANALLLGGVGNIAAHNLIHDAPHQAIGVSGNDHIFEYNVVHHVCTETDDCGAYYKGRNPSCRGNIVRFNFWHDIGSPMGHGNAAVYFDDGDGGDTVFGNVFFRCGDPGRGSFGTVFSHGGHDILAENNIFIECKRALGSAPWNNTRWKSYINAKLWQTRLLREVDITKPPYTTHYPKLVGFMNPKPDQKRVSRSIRNVFVRCADISSGNWQVEPAQNWVTDRDPEFVDASKRNFQLQADSTVFKNLPGFQPIPFEKMGLIADSLRSTLRNEHRAAGR